MRLRVVVALGVVLSLLAGVGAAACGWDWTVVPKEAGSEEAGAKEGGGPKTRDCDSSAECAADEFCAFDDYLCGSGQSGFCTLEECTTTQRDLVCGCDGKIYNGSCELLGARVDFSLDRCAPPAGNFIRCGVSFCNGASSFCFEKAKCIPWEGCTDRTCDCAAKLIGTNCPVPSCDADAGPKFVSCGK